MTAVEIFTNVPIDNGYKKPDDADLELKQRIQSLFFDLAYVKKLVQPLAENDPDLNISKNEFYQKLYDTLRKFFYYDSNSSVKKKKDDKTLKIEKDLGYGCNFYVKMGQETFCPSKLNYVDFDTEADIVINFTPSYYTFAVECPLYVFYKDIEKNINILKTRLEKISLRKDTKILVYILDEINEMNYKNIEKSSKELVVYIAKKITNVFVGEKAMRKYFNLKKMIVFSIDELKQTETSLIATSGIRSIPIPCNIKKQNYEFHQHIQVKFFDKDFVKEKLQRFMVSDPDSNLYSAQKRILKQVYELLYDLVQTEKTEFTNLVQKDMKTYTLTKQNIIKKNEQVTITINEIFHKEEISIEYDVDGEDVVVSYIPEHYTFNVDYPNIIWSSRYRSGSFDDLFRQLNKKIQKKRFISIHIIDEINECNFQNVTNVERKCRCGKKERYCCAMVFIAKKISNSIIGEERMKRYLSFKNIFIVTQDELM